MPETGLSLKASVANFFKNIYKYFMTDKQLVLEAVNKLPENISIAQIAEDVEILAAISKGEEDVAAGRVKSHAEVEKLFASWISK